MIWALRKPGKTREADRGRGGSEGRGRQANEGVPCLSQSLRV